MNQGPYISVGFKVQFWNLILNCRSTAIEFIRQGGQRGAELFTCWTFTTHFIYLIIFFQQLQKSPKKKSSSDFCKNLEILSFPSFHLLFCLPGRTRRSCHIREDEKKLSAAWSISRFRKQKEISKADREREKEGKRERRESNAQRCVGVKVSVCGGWMGVWFHVISSFSF